LAYNDLRWEKSKSFNVGLDLTFIDRINFTFDFYNKTSSNLLLDVPLSQTTGFDKTLMNIGKINNKGIEFEIKTTNIATKDFYWSTSFNIAHNKNTLTYKGFDLNFTFTYSFGGHLYDGATSINSDGGTNNYNGNIPASYKISDIWSPDNRNGTIPQFVYGNSYVQSSRWVQSTDHLRLKNVTFGYTLPKNLLSKLNINNARVYASAVNLFTIKSKDLVVDPELPVSPDPSKRAIGLVRFQTPPLRTVTFGVEVTF